MSFHRRIARALWLSALVVGCHGCSGSNGGGSNHAPVASDDAGTTSEGMPVALDVLANDADPEDDSLTVAAFTNGTNGDVSLAPDGTMTYEPHADFTGTDTFTYEISDGRTIAAATVTITVTPFADFEEAPEPNDGMDPAGAFALPTTGADAIIVHGCIEPIDGQSDFDVWEITVDAPAVLDATVDGFGGLTAGFLVVPNDAFLSAQDWVRFGLGFEGASSSRQVYLPTPGTYALFISDTRSILTVAAAGSPEACYYGTVASAPLPAPLTGTVGTPLAVPAGDVPTFVDYVVATTQSLDVAHTIDGDPSVVVSSVLALRDGVPDEYDADIGTFAVANLGSSQTMRLVVEPTFDMTLSPREVTLNVTPAP